jgi:hypothetical protein
MTKWTPPDALVERVAEVLFTDDPEVCCWDEAGQSIKESFCELARAALAVTPLRELMEALEIWSAARYACIVAANEGACGIEMGVLGNAEGGLLAALARAKGETP